ncbi:unnamed protein product [Brassica oleracea var. botrytis]
MMDPAEKVCSPMMEIVHGGVHKFLNGAVDAFPGWLLNGHRGCATEDELALLLNNHLVFPSPLLYTVASSHSRRPSTAGIIRPLRFTIKPHYIRTSRPIRPYFAAASPPLPLRPSPSPVSTTVSSPTGSAAIKSRSAISKQKEVKRKHASET